MTIKPGIKLGYKPVPELRKEILEDKIVLVGVERAKKMDGHTLMKTEEYYNDILVAHVGTQVWDILKARATVQAEIHARRTAAKPGNTPAK